MTHILITDLREIRYMAYVPEEPKDWTDDEGYLASLSSPLYARKMKEYREALEKAKRESIPFENQERIKDILWEKVFRQSEDQKVEPGIYQVPVEVSLHWWLREDEHGNHTTVTVARIVDKPKEESQEELWSELEEKVRESQWFAGDLYNYMKKHYSITRKRG